MPRFKRKRKVPSEIYDLSRSPFAQKPTQKDLADLARVPRAELNRQRWYKETCVVRRTVEINGKQRDLIYPNGPLRTTHERYKYQLNKIKQPEYLMSPRKGKSQRDNAAVHLDQTTYLTLDIRQFYPSTTKDMVRNWCVDTLGMYEDVARLFADISTVNGVVFLGSPLTPVLLTLVHRQIFDEIYEYCQLNGLAMSLWVDDLTISGPMITGEAIRFIREAISRRGLQSHKINILTGNKVIFVTGVGIVGSHLVAPRKMHKKIRDKWKEYHGAETFNDARTCADRLLSMMGTVRHIVGAKTDAGRKLADQMNSLRQKQQHAHELDVAQFQANQCSVKEVTEEVEVPWV